jgi:hypothetical protein
LLGLAPLEKGGQERAPLKQITPETYIGYARGNSYHPSLKVAHDAVQRYEYQGVLADDMVGLKGSWLVTAECIQSQDNEAVLELNFIARYVYLVMNSSVPQKVNVLLDGQPVPAAYRTVDMNAQGDLVVHEPRVYSIIDLGQDYGRHTITLQCPKGVSAYAFTFGS